MAVNLDIAKMIRFHRKKAGLSQAELASLASVGKTVVFDIEHGKSSVRWSTLTRVLHVLNITISFESPIMNAFKESQHAQR